MHALVPRDEHGRSNYRMAAIRPSQFGVDDADLQAFVAGVAEETAPVPPATYGPYCPDHETLSTNVGVFNVTVERLGVAYAMFDVFTNWRTGVAPRQVVFTPGGLIDCN